MCFSVLIGAFAMVLLFVNPYIKLAVANPTVFNIILSCEMVAGIITIHWILKRFVLKKASVEIPDKGDQNK